MRHLTRPLDLLQHTSMSFNIKIKCNDFYEMTMIKAYSKFSSSSCVSPLTEDEEVMSSVFFQRILGVQFILKKLHIITSLIFFDRRPLYSVSIFFRQRKIKNE